MPRDDPATYAMIGRSETLGCFQIESPGQRELVKKLAPRDVADLIVDISLFRPGPVNSDMIGPFLRARHGLAEPRYPHGKLEDALKETGGVVVFHEQVLRIIDVMTGCGLAEADLVRRHLSTDGGPERTAPWFRAQALTRGFDPVTVERVWQVVAAFGGFGFCKAHAAAFAIPVYQSAWLKRHHPAPFYAGVFTHDPGMYPKRVIIADARLCGVQVLLGRRHHSQPTGGQPSPRVTGPHHPERQQLPPFLPIPRSSPRDLTPRPPASRKTAARSPAVPACCLLESTGPLRFPGLRKPAEPTASPGDPLLPARGQGHQRGRDRPHRRWPALHQPARLLEPRRKLFRPSPSAWSSSAPSTPSTVPALLCLPRGAKRPGAARFPAAARRPAARPPRARPGATCWPGSACWPGSPFGARRGSRPRPVRQTRRGARRRAVDAEVSDGMTDLVPPGQLRDLDLAERVAAELEILGFDLSQHVLHFYAGLLTELGVVRSAELPDRDNGETVLVAGAKMATQTPAVRSGQRIIFASLDDAASR